jgi:hypothetical protein
VGFIPGSPGGGSDPSSAQTATIYVTKTGSDGATGASWNSAKATITAAIAALPANGGIVEVGYGNWNISSPISISTTSLVANIRLRGRESGWPSGGANGSWGTPPTSITNTGTGDAISILGGTLGANGNGGVNIEINDLAIYGNSLSSNGITVNNSVDITLRNVLIQSHGKWGFVSNGTAVQITFDHCWVTLNGSTSSVTQSGGALFSGSASNLITCISTWFLRNNNIGVSCDANSSQVSFLGCNFEANIAGAVNGGQGVLLNGLGPSTFTGCWFESNNGSHVYHQSNSAAAFYGCNFYGDSVTAIAYNGSASQLPAVFDKCYFQQHTVASLGSTPKVEWRGCLTLDTVWIQGLTLPVALAGKWGSNSAGMYLVGIPTSDPHVVGQVWANLGIMTISAG